MTLVNNNNKYWFINCDKYTIVIYDVINNRNWVWVYKISLYYLLNFFCIFKTILNENVYLKNLL